MKKLLKEFKEFALRGNVINLAVGVIVGASFQSVVTSLTTNIISPIIGLFTGKSKNFDDLYLDAWGVKLQYGAFLTSIINFIITALVVFLMVKVMNRLAAVGGEKKDAPAPPKKKICEYCRMEVAEEATRCPYCTSELTVSKSYKEAAGT